LKFVIFVGYAWDLIQQLNNEKGLTNIESRSDRELNIKQFLNVQVFGFQKSEIGVPCSVFIL